MNIKKNLPDLSNQDGALGYLVAWLLGVPMSVLFLVALLRAA